MQQTLITQQSLTYFNSRQTQSQHATTFRQCLKSSQGNTHYQKKLFFLISCYWIAASFFIALPFFLFKKPIYCHTILIDGQGIGCCQQGDQICTQQICMKYGDSIIEHIIGQKSLTYLFRMFCGYEWARVIFKIFPETLPIFGLLLYGKLADAKGRHTAFKITWRIFALGVIIFSGAQAQFLKSFGYILASIHCLPSLILQFILFFQHNVTKQKNRESLLILACLFIGPLSCSFFSELILQFDNRLILMVLCAIPTFVLCFFTNKIYDSPVFVYPYNKAHAFGIVNRIAKQNKEPPIMIDLSLSFWRKIQLPKTDIISLLKTKGLKMKILIGMFSLFTAIFNIKVAQISLDYYTSTSIRSVLVNVTTTLADLTLCALLPKIKNRTSKYLNIITVFTLISFLACSQVDFSYSSQKIITIIHSVLIRYTSQLCYGLLVIWSIEIFPTICRSICVSIVFCGWPIACLTAYLLRDHVVIACIIGLVMTTLVFLVEGFLEIGRYNVMKDLINDQYYDENDEYYKN